MLTRDHTVLPAAHIFIHTLNEPYLPLLHITTVQLFFISCPADCRRLSWFGWLDEILRWFVLLKMIS